MAVVEEYGPEEMLHRLADPWWFQAFGCVLGFDWHSSGLTTVTCGALKEAFKLFGDDLGILVAGGKGAASRKTPQEIDAQAERLGLSTGERLIYASRMCAKVDSAAVQDGFQLYHHAFFFTPNGDWCVIQQGMDADARLARRYHWLASRLESFVCEPHAAVQDLAAVRREKRAGGQRTLLNMVAGEAEASRRGSVELVRERPDWLLRQVQAITEGPTLFAPARHRVTAADVNLPRLRRILMQVHEQQPRDFEHLLGTAGVGAATVRSLALLAELIYDAPRCTRDPTEPRATKGGSPCLAGGSSQRPSKDLRCWADYSYAHGGKDGTPFPVDRRTYDQSIEVLTEAVRRARMGQNEKVEALKRLARLTGQR